MNASRFATIVVPGLPTTTPAPVIRAPSTAPARVLIKNVGAVLVFLSDDLNALNSGSGPSAGSIQMAPGDNDVFVLAPLQTLYGVGVAGGGLLSIALSDAVPMVQS